MLNPSGLIDRTDEVGGRTVHDRRLGAIDFDENVVDLQAREGRQKVLDRADARAGSIAEHRAKRSMRHVGALRLEQPLATAGQSGSKKHDAGIDVSPGEEQVARASPNELPCRLTLTRSRSVV